MTRVGLIARPEDRGLGLQTWEFARHLDCSVLLVDVLEERSDIVSHWDRFPDATRVVWRHGHYARPRKVYEWLDSVDVVYSAETFYEQAFPGWARAYGTATVQHVNPEFWRPSRMEAPTAHWVATPWRLEHLPKDTAVVPYPVALERFRAEPWHRGPARLLHIAGRRAIYDRNGTEALLAALPKLLEPCSVTIVVQSTDEPIQVPDLPRHVELELRGPSENYWDPYPGHDVLVMPRRYGGLCLPVQEAMAAGLAVIMPDVSPNRDAWPVAPCEAFGKAPMHMRAGEVDVHDPDPGCLALAIDTMADPDYRQAWQSCSRSWAIRNSWAMQAPVWQALLENIAERVDR